MSNPCRAPGALSVSTYRCRSGARRATASGPSTQFTRALGAESTQSGDRMPVSVAGWVMVLVESAWSSFHSTAACALRAAVACHRAWNDRHSMSTPAARMRRGSSARTVHHARFQPHFVEMAISRRPAPAGFASATRHGRHVDPARGQCFHSLHTTLPPHDAPLGPARHRSGRRPDPGWGLSACGLLGHGQVVRQSDRTDDLRLKAVALPAELCRHVRHEGARHSSAP